MLQRLIAMFCLGLCFTQLLFPASARAETTSYPFRKIIPGSSGSDQYLIMPPAVGVSSDEHVLVLSFVGILQEYDENGKLLQQIGTLGKGDGQFGAYPSASMVQDSNNKWYITDGANNRIQRFKSDLTFDKKIDGGDDHKLSNPCGVALDGNGKLYIADTGHDKITIVKDVAAEKETYEGFGTSGTEAGQFNAPRKVALDTNGFIYVLDANNNRIQKFQYADNKYNYITSWGRSGNTDGHFNFDAGGDIVIRNELVYILDTGNKRIQTFDKEGNFQNAWPLPAAEIRHPMALAMDSLGRSYVADLVSLLRFGTDHAVQAIWKSYGTGSGQFNLPQGIVCDNHGHVYVADSHNNRIQEFTTAGSYLAQWGQYGSGSGQFNSVWDVTVDSAGNVYATDNGNNRVQKFSAGGQFIAQWGTKGDDDGQFQTPTGIAVNDSYVYVGDMLNNRIQRFTPDGVYDMQWGSSGSGQGEFSNLFDLALDRAGNVYAVDSGNKRIQKFDASGGFLKEIGTQDGDGKLTSPIGVALDRLGNIYVSDFVEIDKQYELTGFCVRIYDKDGNYTGKIGSGKLGSGPGAFTYPWGVAADNLGHVYISDWVNNNVQIFGAPLVNINGALLLLLQ